MNRLEIRRLLQGSKGEGEMEGDCHDVIEDYPTIGHITGQVNEVFIILRKEILHVIKLCPITDIIMI